MGEHLEQDFAHFGISRLLRGVGALRKHADHLEKDLADFGIGRPLNGGVGARLGKAQILGASVDVHGGKPDILHRDNPMLRLRGLP